MNTNENKNELLLREGTYTSLLINLCLPAIVIMVVMVLYNMADIFFIGRLGDPYMIAAVGLAGPVFSVLSGLGTLFGSGGCTVISLALGGGNHEKAGKVSAFCFYSSLLLGLAFTGAAFLFMDPLCAFLGTDETTLTFTRDYLGVFICFAPVSIFSGVFLNLIRADGAAKESMMANLAGTFTNILLDPVFILLFHWGVKGAALATGIGNLVSAVIILSVLLRNGSPYSIRIKDALPGLSTAAQIFALGLPMSFSAILMSFSQTLSNSLLAGHDPIALAAQGIAGKIGMLNSMIAMGICIGMQPAISYSFASGNRERTADILKKTALTTVVAGLFISVISFIFRDAVLSAFIKDDRVLSIGRTALMASIAAGPVYGIYQTAVTWFQSTGRAGCATFCSILNKGLIYVPALYLLNSIFGMYGILFTGMTTDLLSLCAAVLMVLHVLSREAAIPNVLPARA